MVMEHKMNKDEEKLTEALETIIEAVKNDKERVKEVALDKYRELKRIFIDPMKEKIEEKIGGIGSNAPMILAGVALAALVIGLKIRKK